MKRMGATGGVRGGGLLTTTTTTDLRVEGG